jgi:hypothetical protein
MIRSADLSLVLRAGILGAFLIDAYLVVTDVFVLHIASTQELFQWDASNVLGSASYAGGWKTAILGCCMHLIVSLTWALVFVIAAKYWSVLVRRPLFSGIGFGLFVLFVMQVLVLPLGHAHRPAYHLVGIINVLVAHVVFFGIPVAYAVSRPNLAGGAAHVARR